MDSTESESEFGFGFNNSNFSDRILRLVILPDEKSSSRYKLDHQHQSSNGEEAFDKNEKQASDRNKASDSDEKLIHVNSLLLAAKSTFFHKLFSNGMRESVEQLVTLHIQASEEVAVMDLLKFMYNGTISGVTPSALLEVIMVAEKFAVPSCTKLCKKLLHSLPMTLESALLYLDTASTRLMDADIIRPLSDNAKTCVAEHFMHLNKYEKEVLNLHLAGFETVLSSDRLKVISEDQVYDLIQKWVQIHYADQPDEKQTILNKLVGTYLRFPFLSFPRLVDLMTSTDIDKETASQVAIGALSYYKQVPTNYEPKHGGPARKFLKRAYQSPCSKVVTFEDSPPNLHCVVYLDLKQEECESLRSAGGVITEEFYLGGNRFFWIASCGQERIKKSRSKRDTEYSDEQVLGLKFTCASRVSNRSLSIGIEVAWRVCPSNDYLRLGDRHFKMDVLRAEYGWIHFCVPWSKFVDNDSPYFWNGGILRLRVDFTINSWI